MSDRSLFDEIHVQQYPEQITNWWVWDLLFGQLPVLAIRNNNEYDKKYTHKDDHSTWSWRKSNLRNSMSIILPLLRDYKALRSSKRGVQQKLTGSIRDRLPRIIDKFQSDIRGTKVDCIRDLHPGSRHYHRVLCAMAIAVESLSALKTKNPTVPMLGSKVLHFLMPEFFPVWDTERIKKECLANEKMADLRKDITEVTRVLKTKSAIEYATYVHLLVSELAKISPSKYRQVEKACIDRAVEVQDATCAKQVLDWHYGDMSTVVFEICLLGKHRKHLKARR